MADPILHGPDYSTYTRTARLALEEKGVSYELDHVDFLQGDMPAEQLARQPFAKVPALEHDGFQLYESFAMARYVDEAFRGPSLQPDEARERARMTQIFGIIDSYTYGPTVGQLVIQRMVVPMLGGEPDEAAISTALPAVEKAMGVLEGLLGQNSHLAGPDLSLADLHLAPVFAYFTGTPESGPILENKPGLRRWWDAMSARETMAKTAPNFG